MKTKKIIPISTISREEYFANKHANKLTEKAMRGEKTKFKVGDFFYACRLNIDPIRQVQLWEVTGKRHVDGYVISKYSSMPAYFVDYSSSIDRWEESGGYLDIFCHLEKDCFSTKEEAIAVCRKRNEEWGNEDNNKDNQHTNLNIMRK